MSIIAIIRERLAVMKPTAWVAMLMVVTFALSLVKYTSMKISKNNSTPSTIKSKII